ncbi:hypothetical protein AAG906_029551 [Vitis piasezkii]
MAEEQIDRISQLPDDILRSILSLLPTRDLARTNLVSKAWRKLFAFSSLPVLMFQSPDFLAPPGKDTDVSSFINAIDSYLKLRQKDASLEKLRLHVHLNDVESLLDSWIDAALERKVKELDLYIQPRGRARRKPYRLPAKIFAATTITVLSLQRVIMEIYGDIDLPALRKLHLGEIQCDEQPIQKLISSCPLIDCLRIESCHGFEKLHVSGLANLRRLGVLWIEISHHQLKRLDLTQIHFLGSDNYSHLFIPQLKEFFEKLKHCQVIKLLIKSKRELIPPRKLRPILSPPVYDIKHLNIFVKYRCRNQYIIDRLLWMCHPQTLSISSGTSPKFVKVLYNKFNNKEEHPKCCTSCPIKCWRHYLEDVQIDGDESRLEIDRIIAMPKPSIYTHCELQCLACPL